MSSGVPVNVEARNFEGQQICGGKGWRRGLGWVSDFGVGLRRVHLVGPQLEGDSGVLDLGYLMSPLFHSVVGGSQLRGT